MHNSAPKYMQKATNWRMKQNFENIFVNSAQNALSTYTVQWACCRQRNIAFAKRNENNT